MTRKIMIKTGQTWKEIKDLEIKDSGSDPDQLFDRQRLKTPRPSQDFGDPETVSLFLKYGRKIQRLTREDRRLFDLRVFSD